MDLSDLKPDFCSNWIKTKGCEFEFARLIGPDNKDLTVFSQTSKGCSQE